MKKHYLFKFNRYLIANWTAPLDKSSLFTEYVRITFKPNTRTVGGGGGGQHNKESFTIYKLLLDILRTNFLYTQGRWSECQSPQDLLLLIKFVSSLPSFYCHHHRQIMLNSPCLCVGTSGFLHNHTAIIGQHPNHGLDWYSRPLLWHELMFQTF